jgi:4-alpha-glucanotransferase
VKQKGEQLKTIKLALGIHNHQPIGNFDFVFKDGYEKAYLPFLEALERHPKIKLAQHYSGILFEWILKRYPEFVDRLKALVQRGQIEMMTGGYYEPILVNIPDSDKLGQIQKLTQFIKNHTGYDSTGLWLAERIWEPQLPRSLAPAGIEYTVIDDSHFKYSGLQEKDLHGYYITEDTGYTVKIFPISERLRYTIPFQEPEVTIDYLRSLATDDGNNIAVFADDGEKFGIWPGTYQHCFQDRWLERFFSALEANLDWIQLLHFSEITAKVPPKGNVYLPTASYREMMEWALPAETILKYEQFEHQLKDSRLFDQYKDFVRGGFWRNFLVKYPESNNLHKKALYVSKKLTAINDKEKQTNKNFLDAQDHLWAGQCNCPYWHGIFGGLYLNYLRYAIYNNIIQSENQIDKLVKSPSNYKEGWIDIYTTDFNADGQEELLIETKTYNLYFAPKQGGSLFEMDYKPASINLLDTMTRRKEGYHYKLLSAGKNQHATDGKIASIHDMVISKEKDLDKKLHYDNYRRTALIDHFLSPEATVDQFATARYRELGDFISSPYECETKKQNNELNIRMSRVGSVGVQKVFLEKVIQISPNNSQLSINYYLENRDSKPIELWFATEFNYALLAGNASDRYYYFDGKRPEDSILASIGTNDSTKSMGLKDEWLGVDINLSFNKPATVWRCPIETISQSEGGFERVYQSSVVLPNWKIKLQPSDNWSIKIIQKIDYSK